MSDLAELAAKVEAMMIRAVQDATRPDPWADGQRAARMQHAANCAAVATALRARATQEER